MEKFKDRSVFCTKTGGTYSQIICSVYNKKGDGPINMDITCEHQEGGCDRCVNKGKSENAFGETEDWTCGPYETRMATRAPGEDKHTPTKEFIADQEADKVPNKADKFIGALWTNNGNLIDATGRIVYPAQEADKVPNKADKLRRPLFKNKNNLVDATRRVVHQAQKADKVPNKPNKLIGPFWNKGDHIVEGPGRIVY
ncbi:hypothetical protein X797_007615 [Metarhizium robertsii]|uniref:Uncharacterized protein n=1 Tax=Metarhizium robertsii TaxID=568076 RepID=A0A014NC25_9HYPO|nr:hypothetical protein X797_007615 [Metarhizium robertsii]